MANISSVAKVKLESILSMDSGYVLDFSNQAFQSFIYDVVKINIYSDKYEKYGVSKAKRLKAFWDIEGDAIVGKLLEEILLYYEAKIGLNAEGIKPYDKNLFDDCLKIAYALQGKSFTEPSKGNVEDFLKKDVDEVAISFLKIDNVVAEIIEKRILEVKQCLKAGAPLAAIFLCGSILEGILLGIATKNPKEFNQSSKTPKDKITQRVKELHEWSLNHFIEVAYDIGYIGLDVRKYSHTLRDFRNYIHPYQQMSSAFNPDLHTAKISWQVLKAALHDLFEKEK